MVSLLRASTAFVQLQGATDTALQTRQEQFVAVLREGDVESDGPSVRRAQAIPKDG